MTQLETLILTQAANEEAVTSADIVFADYAAPAVAEAMMRLSDAGWFEARIVQGDRGLVVAIGLVDLKTIVRYSLAREY